MKDKKNYLQFLFLFSCLFFGTSVLYLNVLLNLDSSQLGGNKIENDKYMMIKISDPDPNIFINGNLDFSNQATENGWPGNGTINNLLIN